MRTASDRWLGALFHGWVELLSLFSVLFVVVLLLGWAWGRTLRPADRGPAVNVAMLLGAFGCVLLLRSLPVTEWAALIVAVAVIIGGALSRMVRPVGLWWLLGITAALIGLHLHLSALLFVVLSFLALLLSPGQRR